MFEDTEDKIVFKKDKKYISKICGDDQAIIERRGKLKCSLADKPVGEIFETLLTEDIMKFIVKESVMYANQNNCHSFRFSVNCFRKFLGFQLLSRYHSFLQVKMYWSEDEDISIDCVRRNMPRNRYLEIKRNLHSNNAKLDKNVKSFKNAPPIQKLNRQFLQFQGFSKHISIDEQMVHYYGNHYMKQFNRDKPIGFAFK